MFTNNLKNKNRRFLVILISVCGGLMRRNRIIITALR
jgi:hypothetical protein